MKYKIELEMPKSKFALMEELLNSISFVKKVKLIEEDDDLYKNTLQDSIESYEKGEIKPTPLSLAELKEMLNA